MNVIKRSVVADTLKVFLITTIAALLLMTLGGGAKEGVSRGLPPHIVLQIMPYIVPEMLRFVIPGCLLFAVCSVFGRMSASNEIVALKSLGISPLRVVWPVLILAYGLSLFTFWLYDACAVWARPNMRRLVAESIDEIAYGFLRSNRSFRGQGLSIVVKDVDRDRLLQPIVTIDAGKGSPPITLTAQQAQLKSDPKNGTLRIECRSGELQMAGRANLSFPDRFVHTIALRDFEDPCENSLAPAYLGLHSISEQITREESLLKQLSAELATGETSSDETTEEIESQLKQRQARLWRLQAEPHRRLSNGFGCLCFALVGVPIAMGRRSSDTMSIFFVCFLPILLVYYPLLMTGENIARDGVFPRISIWLADIVLAVVGVGLLYRSMRR
jgi:lipopolysaccharide export system permease protein